MSIKNEWRENNNNIYKAICINEDGEHFCGHKYGRENRIICNETRNLNSDTGLCLEHHEIYIKKADHATKIRKVNFENGLYCGTLTGDEFEAYKLAQTGSLEQELKLMKSKILGLLKYLNKLEEEFNSNDNPTLEEIESFNIKYDSYSKKLVLLTEQVRKLELSHKELTANFNDPIDKLKNIAKDIGIIRTKED